MGSREKEPFGDDAGGAGELGLAVGTPVPEPSDELELSNQTLDPFQDSEAPGVFTDDVINQKRLTETLLTCTTQRFWSLDTWNC